MSRLSNFLRFSLGLGAIAAIAACGDADSKLLMPSTPPGGDMFRSYVAMGNSITAGFQSGGINDSVQRQSWAFLLAQQAGTRFAYPSINKTVTVSGLTVTSGCPPMTGNWATQERTDSLLGRAPFNLPVTHAARACSLRDATKATDILNNVAVPGAFATDLLVNDQNIKTPGSTGAIFQFFLGGASQLDRALEADPTFVSLWIGNNETLLPASAGLLGGNAGAGVPALVDSTEFATAFNKVVDSLVATQGAGLRGLLVYAAKVPNVPRFFSADSLGLSASKRTAFGTFTGMGAPAVIGCGTAVTGWLVSIELARAIRAGTHPNVVSCVANTPAAPVGDVYMLSTAEQATLDARVNQYNLAIKAKADQYGFALLNPNDTLAALRSGATPQIPVFPNLTSNTRDAAGSVFGALFSLDGAHPSAAGQKLIANIAIAAINAKYTLQIPLVP